MGRPRVALLGRTQSVGIATLRTSTPRTAASAVAFAMLLCGLYLHWTPMVPDLAAQVARADLVRTVGMTSWSTSWFAGFSVPDYSVIAPKSMATIGVRTTGVIAVVGGSMAAAVLARRSLRPRAASAAATALLFVNLLDGRVTFALGVAFGIWAVVAAVARRPAWTALLAVAAYLASPLAGLFVGMILLACMIASASYRKSSLPAAVMLLVVAGAMFVWFPGTGTMPFQVINAVPGGLCAAGVILGCRNREVRWSAAILLLSVPIFLVLPSAVGSNVMRLAWIAAVPAVVAAGELSRLKQSIVLVGLASWPLADLGGQLATAASDSSQADYYRPLAAAFERVSGSDLTKMGERLEVVDPATHWSSAYLASASLARGWDRQADHANNPIFYDDGALDATTYREWLNSLAVGWVALPAAKLDYAAEAEGDLIASGLPYLTEIWRSDQWRLYRVTGASPLTSGATVVNVSGDGITMRAMQQETIHVRVRWSPYLTVVQPDTGIRVEACISDVGGWTDIYLPRPGIVELTSHFAINGSTAQGSNCAGRSPGS
ncbi:MAG: hypothetical protein JWM76_5163 [Pseudonocardiales bacterium]|nr:hypothetical protein [Pseudonocardiales bacterium]